MMEATTTERALRRAEVMRERSLGEVRSLLNRADSEMRTRRAHPSYGITKASIRELLDVAEGALRVLALQDGRLSMLTLGTSMVDRDGESDELGALIARRVKLSADLKRTK